MYSTNTCRNHSQERVRSGDALRWLVALSIVLLSLGAAGVDVALAQSERDMARFERHLKEGAQLLEASEYARAVEEFEAAREIVDHPRIVFSIADAYEKWGRCARARRGYQGLLDRQDIREALADAARGRLDDIDECVEMTTLAVECEPASATVNVADHRFDCPGEVDLPVGDHEVRVEAAGYETHTSQASLQPEQDTHERIVLIRQARTSQGSDEWMRYAAWGSLGVGAGLMIWGGIADHSAVNRADDIAVAREAGDDQRVQSLLDEADSNRTKTVVLYSAGAALVGTGLVLHWLAPDSSETSPSAKRTGSALRVRARGAGIEALYRW